MTDHLKEIIESLIFISQDPLTSDKIQSVLEDAAAEDIRKAIDELVLSYDSPEHGIRIIQTGGGYIFATKPDQDRPVRRLLQIERKNKLSPAGLETLCSVAYHQPVTQAEISALRGVDSTSTLKTLLEKKLIKIVGRKKAPGNPLVYRTSEKFLQYFGLNSLDELPSEEEIAKILQEEKTSEP
ncbi:SMC-Scp complex subunit ScpB [bacterium]|jgi:segregation and condensation protein B|nr:MAG: SMC-Scp complex subunit ScpB [bacterium]